jgi:hypothetical protein
MKATVFQYFDLHAASLDRPVAADWLEDQGWYPIEAAALRGKLDLPAEPHSCEETDPDSMASVYAYHGNGVGGLDVNFSGGCDRSIIEHKGAVSTNGISGQQGGIADGAQGYDIYDADDDAGNAGDETPAWRPAAGC